MFAWQRPDNLGVSDGALAPCKRTPNCVSSQADPADARALHRADHAAAMAAVRKRGASRCRGRTIVSRDAELPLRRVPQQAAAASSTTSSSSSTAAAIHVRSASRLGRRDFGVNRKRVERLRAADQVEALICVRCSSRRARGSNASRRCRVQRLSQIITSPTRHSWRKVNSRLRGVRPQLVEQRFAFRRAPGRRRSCCGAGRGTARLRPVSGCVRTSGWRAPGAVARIGDVLVAFAHHAGAVVGRVVHGLAALDALPSGPRAASRTRAYMLRPVRVAAGWRDLERVQDRRHRRALDVGHVGMPDRLAVAQAADRHAVLA